MCGLVGWLVGWLVGCVVVVVSADVKSDVVGGDAVAQVVVDDGLAPDGDTAPVAALTIELDEEDASDGGGDWSDEQEV